MNAQAIARTGNILFPVLIYIYIYRLAVGLGPGPKRGLDPARQQFGPDRVFSIQAGPEPVFVRVQPEIRSCEFYHMTALVAAPFCAKTSFKHY